jgi:flagellar M-ring protein FliF
MAGLKEFMASLSNLSTPKKTMAVGLVGVAVTGFVFLVLALQKPSYILLYSGLGAEDASAIVEELKKENVPFQLSADGGSVMIPADKVYELRMILAGKGLPQNGVGFESFDNVNNGTTEFVQKMKFQRVVQRELERTISQLDLVERSRVHIAIPKESVSIEDQKQATASVFLKLKPGIKLHPRQVRGIAYLISGAVEGLSSENVTIMDTAGRVLNGPKEAGEVAGLSSTQMEVQHNMEKGLENRIETMLEKVVGKAKVIARVNAALNFQQVQKTEELYDPNNTVVRSEQTSRDKSIGQGGSPAGIPGAASNVPEAGGGATVTGNSKNLQRQNETINYEINKVTRHVVEPMGTIKRLSVAILVDGTYQTEEGSEERTYVPRTPEEISKYEALVKGIVGFNEDRGDRVHVENIPMDTGLDESWFEGEPSEGLISPMVIVIIRYLLVALFGVLFLIFFVKPLMKSLTEGAGVGGKAYPATVAELESALSGNSLSGLSDAKKHEIKDEVRKLLKENPQLATSIVRNWLQETR